MHHYGWSDGNIYCNFVVISIILGNNKLNVNIRERVILCLSEVFDDEFLF